MTRSKMVHLRLSFRAQREIPITILERFRQEVENASFQEKLTDYCVASGISHPFKGFEMTRSRMVHLQLSFRAQREIPITILERFRQEVGNASFQEKLTHDCVASG